MRQRNPFRTSWKCTAYGPGGENPAKELRLFDERGRAVRLSLP
jgi:hypothetical protein